MSERTSQRDDAPLPEIAGYRLLRVIAHGGMSTVYLARQEALGREVAIKVMRPEALSDEVSRRRFENEARTIGRLEHPHIVGIYQIGRTAADLPYYVMPHMPRGHLGQRDLAGDEEKVREILRALLSALSYAHARGVIHRDVKAENVLFDEAERPLLADFGIALRRGYGSRVTSAGLALGSTAYMAPEQARGEEVDPRADLYSVGVLAWEMLTGELPFKAGDALSMAVMHAQDPVPRLPRHLRHWQRFIDKAMAKGPLKRFLDADDMLRALGRVSRRGPRRAEALQEAVRGLPARLRALPRAAWVVAGLVVAAAAGLALRQAGSDGGGEFFRAGDPEARTASGPGLPSPTAGSAGMLANPDDALLRAAPESQASRLIETAGRQIRAGRLYAPASDNAFDSLTNAAAADPDHLQLPQAVDSLASALAAEAGRRIRAGDVEAAIEPLQRLAQLSERMPSGAVAGLAELRRKVAAAMTARIDAEAAHFDREAAVEVAELARGAALDAATVAALRRRAAAVPAVGEQLPGESSGMTVMRKGEGAYALARRTVGLDDYRRFATATGREAALCRERASVLRVFSPRDWTSPGFAQAGGDAVVCVSWADAEAYARWLSERNGHRYRLPTASEATGLAYQSGATPVAEWLLDCASDCSRRRIRGASWRDGGQARDGDASRGYDDVGFRLVREP
ncbi:bifunctional serine/threonine-protein kinase/formylglycine-generating enzyme family protein [Luteimonas sp. RD2P54]|uniref:Bifunctional serine/threonine-protein kinase/formylglycine-generating enzyme family protein n=1 Tax=Luteimonas endophytica TaxID=3042023 RepID=A0ABT6J971_9GAMM|nr:bifunctional serine/threonine-protein kinase/formylglycine-generating enzyme family protein [Luteimonas endophytica]MDH5823367.1 bifunctional serine/threonine-protein kinase/formylglycine-generating enzyme family protein [Luteimonas endophytica]